MATIQYTFEILQGDNAGETFTYTHKTRAKKIRSQDTRYVLDALEGEGRLPKVGSAIFHFECIIGKPGPVWMQVMPLSSDVAVYQFQETLV